MTEATGVTPPSAGKPARGDDAAGGGAAGRPAPLVIGDRLDTDIKGASAAGLDSLLVLTGVSTVRDLLAARPGERPTYVAADLRGLLRGTAPSG